MICQLLIVRKREKEKKLTASEKESLLLVEGKFYCVEKRKVVGG